VVGGDQCRCIQAIPSFDGVHPGVASDMQKPGTVGRIESGQSAARKFFRHTRGHGGKYFHRGEKTREWQVTCKTAPTWRRVSGRTTRRSQLITSSLVACLA